MKNLALMLLLLLFVASGCTTNYYLVTSGEPTAVYLNSDQITSIPAGNVFITQGKSIRRPTQYGSYRGFAKLKSIRRQVKLNKSEFDDLAFNEQIGYTYKGYTNSSYKDSTSPARGSNSYKSSGGTVNVRGYIRKDGTYVRPHTRSAPRRHKK